MTYHAARVATLLLLTAPGVAAAESADPACVSSQIAVAPQRQYVAVRRLEAQNPKSGRDGWMEARTTLGSDGRLTVEILAEGGSEYIRNKVLRAALESEQKLVAKRAAAPSQPAAPSVCAQTEPDGSGLLRVALKPAQQSEAGDQMVIGHMFVEPATGDLVRVVGRLARNPSFWISRVDVVWNYARVFGDVVLPVSLHSTAKVKMFGSSTFRMTYDYVSVDGQTIPAATHVAR
jgi:hypothetical protein